MVYSLSGLDGQRVVRSTVMSGHLLCTSSRLEIQPRRTTASMARGADGCLPSDTRCSQPPTRGSAQQPTEAPVSLPRHSYVATQPTPLA